MTDNPYTLTIQDVCKAVSPNRPISRQTLYRWIAERDFPPAHYIGKISRRPRWSEAEVKAWLGAE